VLRDQVDEYRRVTVREPLENRRDAQACPLLAGKLHIEPLDELEREVHARVHVGGARLSGAEDGVQPLLLGQRLDDRQDLLLKVAE
jgi:hypothetical protein